MAKFVTSITLGGEKFTGPDIDCENFEEAEKVAKELGLEVDGEVVAEGKEIDEDVMELIMLYLGINEDRVLH
tara:strand:+ start:3171 stop:3386 length:216 start_codon:yes stop_codon:yes gene_type:complete